MSIKLKTGIQQARKGSQLYVTHNVVCQMNFLSTKRVSYKGVQIKPVDASILSYNRNVFLSI